MATVKRHGRWEAYTYVPKAKRQPGEPAKRYIGTFDLKRDAEDAVAKAKAELRGGPSAESMSCAEYADRWLRLKHGPGTRRPSPTTEQVNRSGLRPFLEDFAARRLNGGITRREALDWALQHPLNAKTVSAMFNDAVDDELSAGNPFANRRHKQARGRRDIAPITEAEVDQLGEIALRVWGDAYGPVVRAWILFGAWVGARPGEYFRLEWGDLDFKAGLVRIRRVKPPYNLDTVVFPEAAQRAILAMPVDRVGLVFRTTTGKRFDKGSSRYYWDKVRTVFEAGLPAERRAELVGSRPNIDLYELRHMAASVMADRGLSEFDIAHQLGNSPEVCRDVYLHSYRDRTNDRVRMALERPTIVDLGAARQRRIGGDK